MASDDSDPTGRTRGGPSPEQLRRMVERGRLTEAEAEALSAAEGPTERARAMSALRSRHAGDRLDEAVADGSISRPEADGLLARVRSGEHSRALRSLIAALRPKPDRDSDTR